MKKAVSVLLIVGSFFVLIALLINSYSIKKEAKKGYKMADGRMNPYPKGSPEAANWSKHNPKEEVKEVVELKVEEDAGKEKLLIEGEA